MLYSAIVAENGHRVSIEMQLLIYMTTLQLPSQIELKKHKLEGDIEPAQH